VVKIRVRIRARIKVRVAEKELIVGAVVRVRCSVGT
jgi:hypothetical protein